MNIKSCNRSKIFYSCIIFGCNRNASPSEFPTAKYERHKFAVGIEPQKAGKGTSESKSGQTFNANGQVTLCMQ